MKHFTFFIFFDGRDDIQVTIGLVGYRRYRVQMLIFLRLDCKLNVGFMILDTRSVDIVSQLLLFRFTQ